nr:leucine-rich repeat domain-containing protein [Muribaculaceae bacterium]
ASLKEVTLPAATTSIPDSFFKDCVSLATFVMPAGLKTIGKTSFAGCAELKWIEFTSAVPPTLKEGAFDASFMENGRFYVPDDDVDTYRASFGESAPVYPVSSREEEPVEPIEPIEEWVSRGEATFFDPWICSVFREPRYSWKVEVEESSTRPGYFRMKNPYLNGQCPMFMAPTSIGNDVYINACDPQGVYIESQGLGFTPNSSVAPEFLISTVAGRHQENGTQSLEEDKKQGLTGFFNDGVIKIPAAGMLWSFPPYTDEDYYWCKYDFELRFPGAIVYEISSEVLCLDDYYVNLWQECVKPGETVPVEITTSEHVAAIKYGVIPGVEMPTAAELAAIAAGGNNAVNGRNDFSAPANYVGRMSLIFAALDEAGNVRATCRSLFDVINEDLHGPWKNLGWTRFADVVMLSIYGAQTEPYAVEVEESTSRPGIYRVKNAYSTRGYWTSGEGNLHHHDDENHYLYINAEDPAAVYIMPSPVGLKSNDGSMLLTSEVAVYLGYGYTVDDLLQLIPGGFGTLANGVITIPDSAILASETRYNDGEYYPGNPGLEFRMTLPGQSSLEGPEIETTDSKPRYFNLQGVEVAEPCRGTPVIELRGTRATKLVR